MPEYGMLLAVYHAFLCATAHTMCTVVYTRAHVFILGLSLPGTLLPQRHVLPCLLAVAPIHGAWPMLSTGMASHDALMAPFTKIPSRFLAIHVPICPCHTLKEPCLRCIPAP